MNTEMKIMQEMIRNQEEKIKKIEAQLVENNSLIDVLEDELEQSHQRLAEQTGEIRAYQQMLGCVAARSKRSCDDRQ